MKYQFFLLLGQLDNKTAKYGIKCIKLYAAEQFVGVVRRVMQTLNDIGRNPTTNNYFPAQLGAIYSVITKLLGLVGSTY